MNQFQSTHPRRVRQYLLVSNKLNSYISIHAPAKGATWCMDCGWCGNDISIHAPAKGATIGKSNGLASLDDFNPRTREGCDRYFLFLIVKSFLISIHAPAKGATLNLLNSIQTIVKFQSTHPRRVRRIITVTISFFENNFNPRTREGCDYSIALTQRKIIYFNPRTREGCDT